jgi:pyruvate formate lyase activating enzyme
MLDIKGWDAERHRALTGMDNAPTLAFARRLAALKRNVWLRFVLVPGISDDLEDIRKIATFTAGLGNVSRADVLPFHQMGKFKWKQLNMAYTLADAEPPSVAVVDSVIAVFRDAGLQAY